jgi:hypothetical protein
MSGIFGLKKVYKKQVLNVNEGLNLNLPEYFSYGYFGGGDAPGNVCTIDRLDFSNETVSNPPASSLTQARQALAATSSSSYGYFGGGTPPTVCTIDRLDFLMKP